MIAAMTVGKLAVSIYVLCQFDIAPHYDKVTCIKEVTECSIDRENPMEDLEINFEYCADEWL